MNEEASNQGNQLSKESRDISRLFNQVQSFQEANSKIEELTGIVTFFESREEFEQFRTFLAFQDSWIINTKFAEKSREWGDFQTPESLVRRIYGYLTSIGFIPNIVVEPTFGTGNFIISALDFFPEVKYVYGVEIQRKNKWLFGLSALRRAIKHRKVRRKQTRVIVFQDDIFTHEFPEELLGDSEANFLIIGNPPWVTSSELSALGASNLPKKSNIKEFRGLDAKTGKSNFDIGESVIIRMIELFANKKGKMAFLCKNTVIRNIVKELPKRKFNISGIKALGINAKKEFGISCEASLLLLEFGNHLKEWACEVSLLDSPERVIKHFGWIEENFVSNIDKYLSTKFLDGASPFVWRQGVKHDCSKVMQLKIDNEKKLINGFGEEVTIEDELLFPLLKGSDLRKFEIFQSKRMIVIPQKKLNEDTSYIKSMYSKTWTYLQSKRKFFERRKSSIYQGKPPFSIFGIGDYSFSPYKVAIGGMYKKPQFSLVNPSLGKPMMLDDTCYFLGFDSYNEALFVCTILNSELNKDFLKSIVFSDAKRPYTKEALMRINLTKLAVLLSFDDIRRIWEREGFRKQGSFSEADFEKFIASISN